MSQNRLMVTKRNGQQVPVSFDKILNRIEKQCYKLEMDYIKPFDIAKKVLNGIYDGVTTSELDSLATETAASLTTHHPDYAKLAARLAISTLHKETEKSFSKTVEKLFEYIHPRTGKHSPLVSEEFLATVRQHADVLDAAIIHSRDYNFDYFGFKTLEKSYLLKLNGQIAERPQFMIMRTAIAIHKGNMEEVMKTYELMSEGFFTHATPTLFNSGTPRQQLSSCYLLRMQDDSIEGIMETLREAALISKNAGGIGIAASNIRATGSYIAGTNGDSKGLIPFLQMFNMTARAVDQGGNKRKGAFAIYLEPWHGDIMEFLDLRKNHGKEELRARDLFLGVWMPDLFMQRVEQDLEWSLMCPNECPGLDDCYGEEFIALYEKYESEGKYMKKVKARDVWYKILESQIETGFPYILYKDSANKKSNQKNIGVLRTSNLCAEILEVVSGAEDVDPVTGIVGQTAVCNLASVCLPKYVKGNGKKKKFDFQKLEEVVYQVTVNLNKVIDINYYPSDRGMRSNQSSRPIATGVQGLADVYMMMGMPFESAEARVLNREIFETMYYAALRASNDLAKQHGSYDFFKGSPASQGILQFDMWNVQPSTRYDWEALRASIVQFGLRNSLTLALMPTASTASIWGNEASAEAQSNNLFVRRVLAGEFVCVNKHLVRELCAAGLWNDQMRQEIIRNNGSIQTITAIPALTREIYKTVWEISQKAIIDLYADRGAFIDQTQSMNIFMANPNFAKLNAMHFYGWAGGVTKNDKYIRPGAGVGAYGSTPDRALKTGIYYLRSQGASEAVKFTVDHKVAELEVKVASAYTAEEQAVCSLNAAENGEECLACGA